MFSKHNGMKLEINSRKNLGNTNIWKLKNTLLWPIGQKRKNFIKYFEMNGNEDLTYQTLLMQLISAYRDICSY